jgi:hypothetical protein
LTVSRVAVSNTFPLTINEVATKTERTSNPAIIPTLALSPSLLLIKNIPPNNLAFTVSLPLSPDQGLNKSFSKM